MTVKPEDIKAFPTVFGRDLLAEIPNFVAEPYLVVTMEDLWPRFKTQFPVGIAVWFVHSMERADLESDLSQIKNYASIIGLGGGQAIDAAKYFAWRLNLKLHQFPTSLFNYFAVPTNNRAINAFYYYVTWYWCRALRRRSQTSRLTR